MDNFKLSVSASQITKKPDLLLVMSDNWDISKLISIRTLYSGRADGLGLARARL